MNKQPTSRRRFLAFGGSIAAGFFVAACGQAAAPTTPSTAVPATESSAASTPTPAPTIAGALNPSAAATGTAIANVAVSTNQGANVVQLTYWHSWTGDVEKQVQVVCNAFNKSHPNIQVTPQVVPSTEFQTKILTSLAAGNPPDSMMLYNWEGDLYSFAAQHALTPLEDVVENVQALKQWVLPSMWDDGSYQGKLYAIPQWTQAFAMIWNKELFSEAGLDPEKGPKTTDELFQMAQKLTKKNANGDIDVLGWGIGGADMQLQGWLPGFGGKLLDDAGKVAANDPKNVQALEWMASFAKAADPKKFAAFRAQVASGNAGAIEPLVAKKVAIQVDGPWRLQTLQRVAPAGFQFGVGPTPVPPGGSAPFAYPYGDIPAIPAGVKHKAESAIYVQYLCGFGGEEAYVDMTLLSELHVPSSKKVVEDGKFDRVIKQYPGYQVWLDTLFNAKAYLLPPKIPTAAFYGNRLDAAKVRVLLGEISAKDALDSVTKEAQAEEDKWQATHK